MTATLAILDGGMTTTLGMTWTLTGGPRVLYAAVDPFQTKPDSNRTNNTVSLTVGLPDLAIESLQVAGWQGQVVTMTGFIASKGYSGAPTSVLQIRRDSVTGTLLATVNMPALSPGALQPVTVTWNVAAVASGGYDVLWLADAAAAIAETDEENNDAPVVVRIAPDLVIDEETVTFASTSSVLGATFELGFSVRNLGLREADVTTAALYPLRSGSGAALWQGMVPALLPAETARLRLAWQPVWGNGPFVLVADDAGGLREIDENNNVALLANGRGAVILLPVILSRSSASGIPPVTPAPSATRTLALTPTGAAPSATPTRTATAVLTQPAAPTATRTATPQPARTATATPQPTRTVTATPQPARTATATPQPTRTATRTATRTPTPIGGCTWRDDFTSLTLNPAWRWVREEPSYWSLATSPGSLRIATQTGDLWSTWNNNRNLLLQPAPAGDFEISALVRFNPTQNWQHATILAYQNDDNYIEVGRTYNSGQQADVSYEIGGSPVGYPSATSLTAIYLRLVKTGATYTGYYSANGATWTQIKLLTGVPFTNLRVGLTAWNGGGSAAGKIMADFDWFCVKSL